MNQQEAAALLSVAAAFDNRKPDPDAATAWAAALTGLRFIDCRDAIVAHYRASSEWLMPSVVIAHVKRIRQKRILDHGPIDPPAELDPDDTEGYARWIHAEQLAIANGEKSAPKTAVAGVPMPKELASQIKGFGQLPDDVKRLTDRPEPKEGA